MSSAQNIEDLYGLVCVIDILVAEKVELRSAPFSRQQTERELASEVMCSR